MEKKVILIIISALLAVSLIFNIVQLVSISNAKALSGKVSEYFSAAQKQCSSESSDFKGMSECLDNLMEKMKEKPVLVEAMFVNYYLSNVQSRGVLIFKNIGATTFDSGKFKLYLNNEVQDDDGCEKTGQVPPESLCSLSFKKVCGPGDTLSVEYDGRIILAKSC
jgi:hypothetical protein